MEDNNLMEMNEILNDVEAIDVFTTESKSGNAVIKIVSGLVLAGIGAGAAYLYKKKKSKKSEKKMIDELKENGYIVLGIDDEYVDLKKEVQEVDVDSE